MQIRYLLAFAFVACAASPTLDPGSPDAGDPVVDDGGTPLPPQDGDSCQRSCADFHTVKDCSGKVVETCSDSQGCAGGVCVPACAAAEANKTSVGCDYWPIVPDTYYYSGCFGVFVANTWSQPIGLTLERKGVALDVLSAARLTKGNGKSITYTPLPSGKIPPNEVAIVFVAQLGGGCPAGVTPAWTTDPTTHGTGIGDAFHIKTTAPAVAYQIYPYGGGSSAVTAATLLLPTSAWGTNYLAIDAYRIYGDAWVSVIASQDNTKVTISPTVAIVGGPGVAATGKGMPHTYTINKGQYVEFAQQSELIGSPVQADKPVGMFGGMQCMHVPLNAGSCDTGHQQIPPIRAYGHEYVGVQYRDRYEGKTESPPWRIVGAVDGTTLTWENPPAGAPSSINQGEVAEFYGHGPFIVRSSGADHPFYMAQYMTGCSLYYSDINDCRGDPEFVNMVPAEQYLDGYVFFTDPTYPETNLVVTRKKTSSGFEDVTLDCIGTLTGWKPIGTSGEYETVSVDLVRHNFEKQGACDNGQHRMTSKGTFGVTIWGWGSAETDPTFFSRAVSYAYPAGAGLADLNTIFVPPAPK